MEVELVGNESKREMTQDNVTLVCWGATPWKIGIFLKRVELFVGGWLAGDEFQRGVAHEFQIKELYLVQRRCDAVESMNYD